MKSYLLITVLLLSFASSMAFAQAPQEQPPASQTEGQAGALDEIGKILLMYLILAMVFEAALTPIFSWRVFLERFDGKGYKVPVAVIIVFLVLWKYDLDIFPKLLTILGYPMGSKVSLAGQIVTALLIAGGSDGVLQIFTKLGIRNPLALKKKAGAAQRSLAEKKPPSALLKELSTNGFEN